MELRRENRVPIEHSVSLTVLGDPEILLTATIKNASGRGLGLLTAESVPSGAAVKIELGDSIFLGEVMYCQPQEGANFVGIELTEVLNGLAALSRQTQAFAAELNPAGSSRR
jgi:hypothetical protein